VTHGPAFSGRVGWGARPAVLVVDMVRAYFDDGGPLRLGTGAAVAACASLVDAARAGRHPVVWTVVRYGPGARDAGWFVHKVPALAHFAQGAPGGWGDIVAPLAPAPDETVVVKQYASAFFATSLASTLLAGGVDTVVVCGVSTSGCVRATATDALQHGFRPLVVREACADRGPAIHDANLADLDAKYADVVDLDEAVGVLASPLNPAPSG
jgi:maleamate amidohydrolase